MTMITEADVILFHAAVVAPAAHSRRGARGDVIKILWHDGIGMSLHAKRLEKSRFLWPSPTDGVVGIFAAQLGYMRDGIDWRNPRHTFRPSCAG